MRPGASSLVLSSLVFEYGCDAMVMLDSEYTVRALNPAAQALLGQRDNELHARLDCRSLLGCRLERVRTGGDPTRTQPCLCEQVMTMHRAVARANLRIRPHGRREVVVSASCSPVPVDHLGGVVLVLRALDDFGDTLAAGELRGGELRVDVARHQVYAHGLPIHLTPLDFDLLRHLLANVSVVVSRQELIERVWRYHNVNDRDLIKAHVGALRQCLRAAGVERVRIENVYGVGYMLTVDDDATRPVGVAPTEGEAGDWW